MTIRAAQELRTIASAIIRMKDRLRQSESLSDTCFMAAKRRLMVTARPALFGSPLTNSHTHHFFAS
jgi:hypothetical protein